jgi:sn1-specific diacylglycerol lipase
MVFTCTFISLLLSLHVVLLLANFAAVGVGTTWVIKFYQECEIDKPKEIIAGCVLCNLLCELLVVMTMYCVFDPAGRSWVKMKKYQRSMKESESRFNYRRSGSTNRNWRQRKVIRAYQDSWNQRCRFFFCCLNTSDRNRNSFTDIAKLLSDFFRDLDVVPSDVVAGLVLLRKFQKLEREAVVRQVIKFSSSSLTEILCENSIIFLFPLLLFLSEII